MTLLLHLQSWVMQMEKLMMIEQQAVKKELSSVHAEKEWELERGFVG